jgi:hypothetical protein
MKTCSPLALSKRAHHGESLLFLAVFQQNWENARHIKNERLWFTNIYAIIAAGILTVLQLARDNHAIEITVIGFMVLFSVIGLLTSFRLKAELEECLHNIHQIASSEGLDSLMALSREDGVPIRYPQFRWIFPWFYGLVSLGFLAVLIIKLVCLY